MPAPTQQGRLLLYILNTFCKKDTDVGAAVRAYNGVMQYLIRSQTVMGLELLDCEQEASSDWCELSSRLETMETMHSYLEFPSFSAVIAELEDETPSAGPIEPHEVIPGHTLWAHPHEVHVLNILAASSPDHRNLVESMLLSQPQYQPTSIDTDDERRASIFAESYFKEKLVGLLNEFQMDYNEADAYNYISDVMRFFGHLTIAAIRFVKKHDYTYDRAAYLVLRERIQEQSQRILCLPFVGQHILVRAAISKLDIGAILSALVHRAFKILLDHPIRQELSWRLHHMFIQAAMRSPAPLPDFNGVQEVIELELEAAQFLDPNATPIANYRSKLELETEPPAEIDEDEFMPAHLTDVAREPVGPRRLPTICSAQASVFANSAYNVWPNDVVCTICSDDFADAASGTNPPMLVNCPSNHVFHYDCLDNLINGIASYSNLCPNCRTEICPARPSLAILSQPDSAVAWEESYDVAALATWATDILMDHEDDDVRSSLANTHIQ